MSSDSISCRCSIYNGIHLCNYNSNFMCDWCSIPCCFAHGSIQLMGEDRPSFRLQVCPDCNDIYINEHKTSVNKL